MVISYCKICLTTFSKLKLAIQKLTLLHLSVWKSAFSLAVEQIILEIAIFDLTIGIGDLAWSIELVVGEEAFLEEAIIEENTALSIEHIAFPEAFHELGFADVLAVA